MSEIKEILINDATVECNLSGIVKTNIDSSISLYTVKGVLEDFEKKFPSKALSENIEETENIKKYLVGLYESRVDNIKQSPIDGNYKEYAHMVNESKLSELAAIIEYVDTKLQAGKAAAKLKEELEEED